MEERGEIVQVYVGKKAARVFVLWLCSVKKLCNSWIRFVRIVSTL